MAIRDEIQAEMKDALRQHDGARLDVIRQVKADVERAVTAPGFEGEADDELYEKVIAAYAKKMTKALGEYEGYGERAETAAAKLRAEVEYLQRWLPEQASDDEVAALVDAALAQLGVTDPQQAGRVTGHLMKTHQGLDGAAVNRIVRERLQE